MSGRGGLLRQLGEFFLEPPAERPTGTRPPGGEPPDGKPLSGEPTEARGFDARFGHDHEMGREPFAHPAGAELGGSGVGRRGSGWAERVVPRLSCVVGMRPSSEADLLAKLLSAHMISMSEEREVILVSPSASARHARVAGRREAPAAVARRAVSLGLAPPPGLHREAAVSVLRPPPPEESGDALAVFMRMLALVAGVCAPVVWEVPSRDVPFASAALDRADAILLVEDAGRAPQFARLVADGFASRWARPIVVRTGSEACETGPGEIAIEFGQGRKPAWLAGASRDRGGSGAGQIDALADRCCEVAACR